MEFSGRCSVALLLLMLGNVCDAQTVTVRLTEEFGKPLTLHVDGSLVEPPPMQTPNTADLQDFAPGQLIGFDNGFFLVSATDTVYDGYPLSTPATDLSGCHGFLNGTVTVPNIQLASDADTVLPTVGFTADLEASNMTAGLMIASSYEWGTELNVTTQLPSYTFLADIGWRAGGTCSMEWTGANGTVQRVQLVAEAIPRLVQTARLELYEDDEGNVVLVSSGHLSDTRGLEHPIAIDPFDFPSSIVFGAGFYVTHPGVPSAVFSLPQAWYHFNSGCDGLFQLRTHSMKEDLWSTATEIPTFGFDTAYASVILNLPSNYTAGSSFAGQGVLPQTRLADLNLAPGARCHIEWLPAADAEKRQRVAVNVAEDVSATVYWITLSSTVANDVVDEACTEWSRRVLDGRVYQVQCAVTQGIELPGAWTEIQLVVRGKSAGRAWDMLDRLTFGEGPVLFGETVQVNERPSSAFQAARTGDFDPLVEFLSRAVDSVAP